MITRHISSTFVIATVLGLTASAALGQPAEPGAGPGHGAGPDPDPRLGDTSTLMETVPLPESVDECGITPGYTRLLCLTTLLDASASDELLELIHYDYSVEEAQVWSNLPAGAVPDRPGAYLGELTLEQRGLVKAIMMEATGTTENEGYDEMLQTLNADDYIGTVSSDYKAGYSSFAYTALLSGWSFHCNPTNPPRRKATTPTPSGATRIMTTVVI